MLLRSGKPFQKFFKTAALAGVGIGAVGVGLWVYEKMQGKELVQQGRVQSAEMKSAFPDINLRAEEGSLTQDELNAFKERRKMDEKLGKLHMDHLEDIPTHKQLHDIENAQLVQEAVNIERNKFGKQIGSAVDRLNTIEQALNSRSAQDLENRRAKIFWTVCLNLMDTLRAWDGNSSEEVQMATKLKEVKFIPELTENDEQGQRQPTATQYHPDRGFTRQQPKKTKKEEEEEKQLKQQQKEAEKQRIAKIKRENPRR